MKAPSRRSLLLLSPLLLVVGVIVYLGASYVREYRASSGPREMITQVVSTERIAAEKNVRRMFLDMQDPSVPGWREYQAEAWERDRLLNRNLGEVKSVELKGDLALVTLSLSGVSEPWEQGALYRRYNGRWYHTVPNAGEEGQEQSREVSGARLLYTDWDASRADRLTSDLQAAKSSVDRLLGTALAGATVRVHPSPLSMPPFAANAPALYEPRTDTIHVLSPYYWPRPEGEEPTQTTLAHEYAHYAVDKLAANQAPVWLNEGIATVASGEWEHVRLALPGMLDRGEVVTLQELPRAFESSNPAPAYVTSAGMVDYIVRRKGEGALPRLLREMAEGKDANEALQAVAGMDAPTLYERWIEQARVSAGRDS